MKYDSISIAIPTLNEEQNISKCLSSIFRQKFNGKLEVFVIDGGSMDKTIEIAKTFHVNILNNPKRDAESGKLIGLKNATCDYFMILDADMELCGSLYFQKLLRPLKDDQRITGAYGKYVSFPTDTFLTRFITLDLIQRDPLFRFLTVSPHQTVKEKYRHYWLCEYTPVKIVPHGFSIYRRKQLLDLKLHKRNKFMELDTIMLLVRNGYKYFAYVHDAKLHHPFLVDLTMLIKKRIRNLKTQFFYQKDKREFTWIDFGNKLDILKILFWIMYANSLIFPMLVGIWRAFRYRSAIALYEPVFTWITTNLIIAIFLLEKDGRKLLVKSIIK